MPKRKTQLEKRVDFLVKKLRPVFLPELAAEKISNKYKTPIEKTGKASELNATRRGPEGR